MNISIHPPSVSTPGQLLRELSRPACFHARSLDAGVRTSPPADPEVATRYRPSGPSPLRQAFDLERKILRSGALQQASGWST
jgi:hypothetical protein